ncbi:Actin cross-linking [Penicillium italicum]|uniref:Actin cross-linking n=1 Tax=Penicillium italicum TaxID=40296 RepID=A0A0A2KRX4_PENIT|nr:Actin cross-linking [Penicillium italicum]
MSSTTTEDERCDTPIYSSVCDGSTVSSTSGHLTTARSRNCPWKGRSFVIRDPNTGLVIGLQYGILRLVSEDSEHGCGIFWSCVESDEMLLGFQNMVSGTFIGHNNKGKLIAWAKSHRDWESFCVREHPDGGYVLLVKQGSGFLPMRIDGGTQLVVSSDRDEGVAWEFTRVEHECSI